jgi:hypothetical protein
MCAAISPAPVTLLVYMTEHCASGRLQLQPSDVATVANRRYTEMNRPAPEQEGKQHNMLSELDETEPDTMK